MSCYLSLPMLFCLREPVFKVWSGTRKPYCLFVLKSNYVSFTSLSTYCKWVWVCRCVCIMMCLWTACRSWLFPSVMWTLGIRFRSSGMMTSTFISWAILSAYSSSKTLLCEYILTFCSLLHASPYWCPSIWINTPLNNIFPLYIGHFFLYSNQ